MFLKADCQILWTKGHEVSMLLNPPYGAENQGQHQARGCVVHCTAQLFYFLLGLTW